MEGGEGGCEVEGSGGEVEFGGGSREVGRGCHGGGSMLTARIRDICGEVAILLLEAETKYCT